MRTLSVFIACFLGLAAVCAGTPRDIRFSHLSLKDGLSQSTVFCIVQDRYGFMWFGTNDGLNRYDGYSFEHFKYDGADTRSLTDSWISSLFEDSAGNLWVGTFNHGLSKLSDNRTYFTRVDLGLKDAIPKGLGQNLVYGLAEPEPGLLWVGLESAGIVVLRTDGTHVAHLRHDPDRPGSLPSDEVFDILPQGDGRVWVGGSEGLALYAPDTGLFAPVTTPADDGSRLKDVRTLLRDTDGRVWIGTAADGLYRYAPDTDVLHHFQGAGRAPRGTDVHALFQDAAGVVWVGTRTGGLNAYDAAADAFQSYGADPYNPTSLGDNAVYSLFQDAGGLMWVGTYSEGLSKFNLGLQVFTHVRPRPDEPDGLSGNNITSFAWEGDKLWVGTRKSGLNLYDPADGRFTHYRAGAPGTGLSSDQIRHISLDAQGVVWVGTEGGLDRIDPVTRALSSYRRGTAPDALQADSVMYVTEDAAGRFWVGTYEGGLHRFDRASGRFHAYTHRADDPASISSNLVNHILCDADGRMWVGTEDGLDLMDPEQGRFVRYHHDPEDTTSLRHPSVMTTLRRRNEPDVLWVGTYGGGLNRLDCATGRFEAYTTRRGLANDAVYGVLEDDRGRLWISTNGGISRFTPEDESFRNFDESNGLARNEFNRNAYGKGPDGRLYFGGFGYVSFHPEAVTGNSHVPPIALTSVQVGNTPLAHAGPLATLDKLQLAHNDKVLFLSFAALDFNSPEQNRFAHRLEGMFEDWVVLDRRHDITYTSLRPGSYILRIKGANNDGVWNDEGLALPIVVAPPWWAARTAYLVYFLLLAALALAVYRRRMNDQKRELQRAMSLGKAEFATTVLHNIGNVLNSVKIGCDKTGTVLRTSKLGQLLRAHELFQAHLDDIGTYLREDPRGKLLPGYFRSAGEIVEEEHREMLRECEEMAVQIALMKDIIETQQAHASISLMDETHNLNQVVRDALKVQESGLHNRGIQVEERLRPLPPVKVPKTQLMHIVINLVKNAREAMDANGDREKKLLLETGRREDGEVFLSIRDTGVGISRENLGKMFTYGFTTKPGGHGFGLNYCARAMKDMGGTIEVESEGVGRGAAFTLLFRRNVSE